MPAGAGGGAGESPAGHPEPGWGVGSGSMAPVPVGRVARPCPPPRSWGNAVEKGSEPHGMAEVGSPVLLVGVEVRPPPCWGWVTLLGTARQRLCLDIPMDLRILRDNGSSGIKG